MIIGIVLTPVHSMLLHAQIPNMEYGERRAALATRAGDGHVLAMGSAQPPEDYINFYQNSPFRYLTGFLEPNAALIMLVDGGSVTDELLFVNPRNPAEETWEGYRLGPEGTDGETGIQGRSVEELETVFDSLVGAGWETIRVAGTYDPAASVQDDVTQRVDALLDGRSGLRVDLVSGDVGELRGVKSTAELDLIRRAATITSSAQRELMQATATGVNEFEIQALVEYTFRRYGAERPSFASIVGSGPNSTVLHYNANDRFLSEGDVVVVDIGASYEGYAADITRTLPVNGRFTEEQREIYQLVRDAQSAAEAIATPGVSSTEMAGVAVEIIAQGLADLGLIESQWATYQDVSGREIPQYFLYYMHALSHGLGLDVHDPWPSVMEPGVAFTIEPGVYVRPNLFTEVVPDSPANRRMRETVLPAFQRYAGIGVRIEDDYIITPGGVERISTAPREIEEIEALMAAPWDGPETRNAEWVDWYRRMR
jgi:Xaa-Pro aminopeptidase